MKPIGKREKHQRYAHMLVLFEQPEEANTAIRNGLYIRGARVWPQLLFPEPLRCNKCSHYANHKAADCTAEHDQCGLCGQDHKTSRCTVTLPVDMYCGELQTAGSRGWSQETAPRTGRRNGTWMRATQRRNSSMSSSGMTRSTWEPAEPDPGPPPPHCFAALSLSMERSAATRALTRGRRHRAAHKALPPVAPRTAAGPLRPLQGAMPDNDQQEHQCQLNRHPHFQFKQRLSDLGQRP